MKTLEKPAAIAGFLFAHFIFAQIETTITVNRTLLPERAIAFITHHQDRPFDDIENCSTHTINSSFGRIAPPLPNTIMKHCLSHRSSMIRWLHRSFKTIKSTTSSER